MRVTVFVPGFGSSTYEADNVASELAALRSKFSEVADQITVRESAKKQWRKYSDTELAAMEEA